MEEKNISDLIEEVRGDLHRMFNERSNSKVPELGSSANVFSIDKCNKVHPEPQLESYKNARFANITADNEIKDDVKKLRIELKQTYDLLINARDTLETINFENIKNKIKDLHTYPTDAEIDKIIQNRPLTENLDELTSFMRNRFKDHPGEFGDIPEVKTFFQTCNQLQRGLKNLELQSKGFEELQTRVTKATEMQRAHAEEMRKFLNISDTA